MGHLNPHYIRKSAAHLVASLSSPLWTLAIAPVIFAAELLYGALGLKIAALGVPVLVAALQLAPRALGKWQRPASPSTIMQRALDRAQQNDGATGALLLALGPAPHQTPELAQIQKTIAPHLHPRDVALPYGQDRYLVVLSPERDLDLESALQTAKSLQNALAGQHPTQAATVGFCLSARLPSPSCAEILAGAEAALAEALHHGPGSVRSYSGATRHAPSKRDALVSDFKAAIADGEIRAYFQPQISTRTGDITGFEALIRWQHPDRGLIPPVEFLPMVADIGQMGRISRLMIQQSLQALDHWRNQGLSIPRIGVNFSTPELAEPRLVEWLGFELDRYDLSPDRIAVEVLETVVADQSNDAIIQNLADLARLGCCIDLDDFGTGHASITNIHRFSVERIKIDRSFVSGIDTNPEQQNMVAAILTMADRLGLETLAEGIETEAERALLSELGCGHIQGFGIARPMPLKDTAKWIRAYQNGSENVVPLSRQSL